tara:strand:+ start:463 stop:852 length:390 start_codon:yes stop_codon:yes gene_type:complete
MLGSDTRFLVQGHDITGEVFDALCEVYQAELASAEKLQTEAMRLEHKLTNGERAHLPFGRIRLRLVPEVFHFWGGKLGYECWKDKDFLGWMEKRFGNLVAIKSKSRTETVAVPRQGYNPDDKLVINGKN